MKIKTVYRYYCDHCNKGSCAKGHMRKHELHCTMNPNRICRVCKLLGTKQQPISKLIDYLPSKKDYPDISDPYSGHYTDPVYITALEQAISKLRDKTRNCPACILATLRQATTIEMWLVETFNFKSEMEELFATIHKHESEY